LWHIWSRVNIKNIGKIFKPAAGDTVIDSLCGVAGEVSILLRRSSSMWSASAKDANQPNEIMEPVLLVQHNLQERTPAAKLCTFSKQKKKKPDHVAANISQVSKMDNY
jgi:hypothetical protein